MINIAQAGPIADAPSIVEILLNVLQGLLNIVAGVAVLAVVISGVVYIVAIGDPGRLETAKKILIGSIIGLAVALLALVIVTWITGLVA